MKQDIAPAMDYLRELSQEVLAAGDIWTAIEIITNSLGAKAGGHMESMLSREIAEASSQKSAGVDQGAAEPTVPEVRGFLTRRGTLHLYGTDQGYRTALSGPGINGVSGWVDGGVIYHPKD